MEKNKLTGSKILFFISIVFLSVAQLTLAQVSSDITITGLAANVANVIWIVATVIVVVFWVITGVAFLTAQGDPSKMQKAKLALFTAVGGTVIVILAYSVMSIISNAIFFGA
jgi:uncharacterized membrane protein YtjA (UPF0391 family)